MCALGNTAEPTGLLFTVLPLQVLKRNCSDPSVTFEILSNPEFLAEGTAMEGEAMRSEAIS
jgi:UDP-glucose 6-dehydrogenase